MIERKWNDADVYAVELLAFGVGLLLAAALAAVGWLFDQPWLIVGPGIGGVMAVVRAVVQAHRLPWWRLPDPTRSKRP